MSGVQLTRVTKDFGPVRVIHGVDLDIRQGEFCVFVGPSGCGKSTLLRMIAGLEETTEGQIRIEDEDVTDAEPADRGVAMVFQTYALYPHMTVAQNMGFGLKMNRHPKAEIAAKVAEASRILKLDPLLERKPAALSGGQRQRVAIGRAIVRGPKVFLFDEPLSNLDAELRVEMRAEIARLHREIKATMIYVTHDQVEAMTMADKIVVLHAGRIEQVGSPMDLYRAPKNLFVAGFIGSPKMNLIGGPAAAEFGATTIGIRPEHISVSATEGKWKGRIGVSEHLGSDTFLYVEETGLAETITVRSGGNIDLHHGDTVWLTPDTAEMHRFDDKGDRIA